MKKLLLFIVNFWFVAAMGQNLIAPITISMPANPPANTADWATAMPPVMIMAQTKMDNGHISPLVIESKILVYIEGGGTVICGSYNQQTAPQSNFNSVTKTWSGAAVLSLLGKDCILKPGTYKLCVQFYGLNASQGKLLGEACKSFNIADTKEVKYSPPQNLAPANGISITQLQAKQPMQLKWVQILPPPPVNDVMYTVHVFVVEKGQSPAQAAKTNTPVFVKEVNTTQTTWQIPTQFTSSKETQTFVWNVQLTKAGKPYVRNNGISAPTSFSYRKEVLATGKVVIQ